MTTICCNHPCFYENEGVCTLTHVTSVSEITNKDCAYFRTKEEGKNQIINLKNEKL